MCECVCVYVCVYVDFSYNHSSLMKYMEKHKVKADTKAFHLVSEPWRRFLPRKLNLSYIESHVDLHVRMNIDMLSDCLVSSTCMCSHGR